jgi:hypothetical protein
MGMCVVAFEMKRSRSLRYSSAYTGYVMCYMRRKVPQCIFTARNRGRCMGILL